MLEIMQKNACEKGADKPVCAVGRRKARGRLAEPKRVLLVVMQVLMLVVMQVLMRCVQHAAGCGGFKRSAHSAVPTLDVKIHGGLVAWMLWKCLEISGHV